MTGQHMVDAASVRHPMSGAAGPVSTAQRRMRAFDWSALVIVVASLLNIFPPSIRWDYLNVVPTSASVYLGWRVLYLAQRVRVRDVLLVTMLLLCTAEFGLRVLSLQRALIYQRFGDLLFAPVPNQKYTEKISLTSSRIDENGLREPSPIVPGRRTILCLGDSITYGYAMADTDTWPAQLGVALNEAHPNQFNVLNGGVNAYPMAFIHQKFLYHWNRGLRPRRNPRARH